jgi:hypothetical protein
VKRIRTRYRQAGWEGARAGAFPTPIRNKAQFYRVNFEIARDVALDAVPERNDNILIRLVRP